MALLATYKTDFGTIRVTRSKRDGTVAYYQNGCFHSQVNDKGDSICVYIHAIQELIRQHHARRVLIIGCAGGSLATMLRRLHCKVTVVDINPTAFVIAKRHFNLSDDIETVTRDGIAYLRTTRKRYDAVVVDVFGSNNTVPDNFTTTTFFKMVQTVLSPSGLMIMNVITANDDDQRADVIARKAKASGMPMRMFDWPHEDHRNTLLVGGYSKRLVLPSGNEADWIEDDFAGIVCRGVKNVRGS